MRRLAPDCCRIELSELTEKRDEEKLLAAMGQETANIHLGDAAARFAIGKDLVERPPQWLAAAAARMAQAVEDDWKNWKHA